MGGGRVAQEEKEGVRQCHRVQEPVTGLPVVEADTLDPQGRRGKANRLLALPVRWVGFQHPPDLVDSVWSPCARPRPNSPYHVWTEQLVTFGRKLGALGRQMKQ